jgi:hypothetical protein
MSNRVTHAWLQRVSDYHSGGISAAARAAVEAHLATCAECRQALAAYQHFYTLTQSPLHLGEPTLLARQEETVITGHATRDTRSTPTIPPRRPRGALTALEAIDAVLVLALLAASLFALFSARQPSSHQPGPVPHPTYTSTLDAQQTQAYLAFMNTYYRPLGADMDLDDNWAVTYQKPIPLQALVKERPVEARILSEAQVFLDHMTVTPPAQLRADDGYLKQAARLTVTLYVKRVASIDAQDLQGWIATSTDVLRNRNQYCGPIDDINALLPPNASLPYASEVCDVDFATPTP